MTPIYLKWFDHNTFDGTWIDTDCVPSSPLIIETVGFLITETDDVVSICLCHSGENNSVRSTIQILKCCIIERKQLIIKSTRKKSRAKK